MITIKIAHLARNLRTIKVKENSTVAFVLEKLSIQPSGDIFVNGKRASKATKLRNGDIIGIVGQVEGGN
jgi:sulfur carrier protein ThiS